MHHEVTLLKLLTPFVNLVRVVSQTNSSPATMSTRPLGRSLNGKFHVQLRLPQNRCKEQIECPDTKFSRQDLTPPLTSLLLFFQPTIVENRTKSCPDQLDDAAEYALFLSTQTNNPCISPFSAAPTTAMLRRVLPRSLMKMTTLRFAQGGHPCLPPPPCPLDPLLPRSFANSSTTRRDKRGATSTPMVDSDKNGVESCRTH